MRARGEGFRLEIYRASESAFETLQKIYHVCDMPPHMVLWDFEPHTPRPPPKCQRLRGRVEHAAFGFGLLLRFPRQSVILQIDVIVSGGVFAPGLRFNTAPHSHHYVPPPRATRVIYHDPPRCGS